jgi:SM-20-related protein
MPRAEFFARFGILIVKDFFDEELCVKLQSEASSRVGVPAQIRQSGNTYVVDESFRSTKWVEGSATTQLLVRQRLLTLEPKLESHFGLVLTGCEEPQFLAYKEGDFYRPHKDNNTDPDAPKYSRARQVSVIVFLSSEAEEPGQDTYGGGFLTFYGLMGDLRLKRHGFSLSAERGLLVAFRSNVVHEVTPVTHGERYTIVSWYF